MWSFEKLKITAEISAIQTTIQTTVSVYHVKLSSDATVTTILTLFAERLGVFKFHSLCVNRIGQMQEELIH